jgi:hypothetical protein
MTETPEYLIANGWRVLPSEFDNKGKYLWFHPHCHYFCREEVAYDVQRYREEYKNLPWYKKLHDNLFGC